MTHASLKPAASTTAAQVRLGRQLIQRLYVCVKATQMYDHSNVAVQESSSELAGAIRTLCRTEGQALLAQARGMLLLNGLRLRPDLAGSGSFQFVLEQLSSRGVGSVILEESVAPRDLVLLCDALNRSPRDREDSFDLLAACLREAGVAGLRIEPTRALPEEIDDDLLRQDVKQRSVESFFKSIELTRRALSASDPEKLDFRGAKRVVQRLVDEISEEDFILLSLASIKNYDQYTFNHSTNVAVYAITFGQRLGLDRPSLASLGMAGLFHDLGKTRVSKQILNKTTLLDAEEWEEMKAHSVRGAEILLKSRKLNESVVRNILVAFEHHLNADLGGYPQLSDRRELNLFSKIVAIADCYDALTTPRVYRSESYTPQEALSIMMEGRGTVFDPVLLKVFINTIGVHPVGSIVELESGEKAVVCRCNPAQMDRPVVRVFAGPDGERVPQRIVDLSVGKAGQEPLRILRTVDPGSCFETIEAYLEIL